jgi:hypothetical protein
VAHRRQELRLRAIRLLRRLARAVLGREEPYALDREAGLVDDRLHVAPYPGVELALVAEA